jgi:hypothetical protein
MTSTYITTGISACLIFGLLQLSGINWNIAGDPIKKLVKASYNVVTSVIIWILFEIACLFTAYSAAVLTFFVAFRAEYRGAKNRKEEYVAEFSK